MRTKLLAIIAVLAMAFAGAAVIAQDNVSDEADATDFAADSAINMFGKATGIVAYHYGTTNGMLYIKLDTAIAGHAAVVITATAYTSESTPAAVATYDPLPGGKEIYVNVGDVANGYYVTVFAHGETFAYANVKASCAITSIAASNVNLDKNEKTATLTEITSMARNVVPGIKDASPVATTDGKFVLSGWATTASGAAVLDYSATLEEILAQAVWNSTNSKYEVFAKWAPNTVTVSFNWNKPAMNTERFVYATNGSEGESDVAVPTQLTLSKDGDDYIVAEQIAYSLKGYTLAGWFTKAVDGTQAQASPGTSIQDAFTIELGTIVNSNTLTLYAHWVQDDSKYTITYSLGTEGVNGQYTITGTPAENWNVYADNMNDALVTVKTIENLKAAAAEGSQGSIAINAGYVFSHWNNGSTPIYAGESYENLDTNFDGVVTLTAVYDYVVSFSGTNIVDVKVVPQERASGYDYLIDGDAETKTFKFRVYYDDAFHSIANPTVASKGTAGNFGDYTNGYKEATISAITGPITINVDVTELYYKVTVNSNTTGSVQVDSTTVETPTANSKYTVTWTKFIPKDEFGMLTISAKGSELSGSYAYSVEATGGTAVKVSDKTWKITPQGDMTITVADELANGTNSKISDMYVKEITNSSAVGYISAVYEEVPAGTITAVGTMYALEGGISAYTNLKTGTGSNYQVTIADVTSSIDAAYDEKAIGNKTALGTGANEYQFTIAPTNGMNLYALYALYASSDGNDTVKTSVALIS